MSTPSTPNNGSKNPLSSTLDRFRFELEDMSSGFTLLDTLETFFDSHVDLLQRRLQKHSDRLKLKAEETFIRRREIAGDKLAENYERFKLRVSERMTKLVVKWQDTKVVRTREKVSFFLGVMLVLFSTLLYTEAPEWVPLTYTILSLWLLTIRVYHFKKRDWHYFLFDLCYFINALNLIYIWILPSSTTLFVACYCLTQGSLGSAVITWRNSLVFHDLDKITSIFIHIYPVLTLTVIRHYYPNATERFPALAELPHLQPLRATLLSCAIYLVWQLLYYKLVLIDRWAKIESGQRTTSFSFLLTNKRGLIGKALSAIPPNARIRSFMFGQLIYTILTLLPAVYVFYDSAFWSSVYIIVIFAVSVWNGGGFYIEVFGRKFERELEALRRELAEASRMSSTDSTASGRSSPTALGSMDGFSSAEASPTLSPRIVSDHDVSEMKEE